jgi:hypothetical protein
MSAVSRRVWLREYPIVSTARPLPTDDGVISPKALLVQALDASTSLQARIRHGSSPLQVGPRHSEKPHNTWVPPQDMC